MVESLQWYLHPIPRKPAFPAYPLLCAFQSNIQTYSKWDEFAPGCPGLPIGRQCGVQYYGVFAGRDQGQIGRDNSKGWVEKISQK